MEEQATTTERLESETAEQPLNLETAKLEALRLVQMGGMSFAYLSTVTQLAAAELILSAKTIPKLVGVGLFLVPVVYFAWLGFSALVGWSVYLLLNHSLYGLATFFLLQCLLLLIGFMYIRRASRAIGFKQSKAQISTLVETIKHEFHGERSGSQQSSR